MRERLASPGRRAISEAGPPTSSLVIAGVASIPLMVGAVAVGAIPWSWWVAVVPVVAFALAAAADRDGWAIRMALAHLSLQQAARWPYPGGPPSTTAQARTFLTGPDGANANGLQRASISVLVGDTAAARREIESFVATSPTEAAAEARLRAILDATPGRSLDAAALDPGIEAALSADDLVFHRLSLAWAAAHEDIMAGRPWRSDFAARIRGLGPLSVPARYRVTLAVQHASLAIALAVGVSLMSVLLRL